MLHDCENISYHIDDKLIFLLEIIKDKINKKDKDYVMLIDGYEGEGKTTFGLQMGRYVDPSLNLSRVCMTAEEFKSAINNAKKGQCVIYDEAITGLGSGDVIARVGKLLKSLMMQMRQKNLFVIVIIPYIFELNKYAVLSRTRFFFHVYEKLGKPGYWAGFNKKGTRETYIKGKKTHSYLVKTLYIGRFYGKFALGEEFEGVYRKKKEKALKEGETAVEEEKYFSKYKEIIKILKEVTKMSNKALSKFLFDRNHTISSSTVGNYTHKPDKSTKTTTQSI